MVRASTSITRLYVFLFGAFRLELNALPVFLPTRKIESFLAYLILHPEPHTREKLAALCWGDVSDVQARASLRTALAAIRKHISAHLLITNRQSIQINSAYPMWVDVFAFEKGIKSKLKESEWELTTNGFQSKVNELQRAISLYQGDLLSDFYDDWIFPGREYYRSLYIDTLLGLAQEMRSHSEYEHAIEFAQKVLASDPANERAHQHLMFCYLANGDRSAALKQYDVCQRALREELAVDPLPETTALYQWIRQAPSEVKAREAQITNLPIPLTSFIGRKREMAEVKYLLSTTRLLTLTGAGGSGKTRLAIQVATDLLDGFKDGVWWMELAALKDETLVPQVVAKALGVSEQPNQSLIETLKNFLQFRHLLLILDNCEHLIEACARLVDELLRTCPNLKILATSREILDIDGESTWRVPTLSVPDLQPVSLVNLLTEYEAILLFVERARAVKPNFALTEETAPIGAQICQRLDGIPLAIELAATRVKMLSVKQIAARLEDRFTLLTKGGRITLPRHQTLRAAIDWSHDLLPEKERILFRRLSAFAGGWTLPAAEAICTGAGVEENEVFDLLSRLVDKSLVEVQPGGEEARYRMLQTVRQYSSELLLESGESGTVRNRHLDYFTRLVEAANPHLGFWLPDRDRDLWLSRFEAEYDNLRTAVRWIFETENGPPAGPETKAEAGLRLAGKLHWFWFARARFSEGRSWLTQLLEIGHNVSTTTRAQALVTAGYMACWQGEFASGRSPLEEALTLFRQLQEGSGIAYALHGLGVVALCEGHATLGCSLFKRSLKEAKAADDKWLTAFSLHFLAIALSYQGKYAQALSYFEEGDALREQLGGNKQGRAFSLFHLARIGRHLGDYAAARSRHAEAMLLFQQTGDRRGIGYSLAGFAVLSAAQGDMQRAARLSGALASLERVLGSFLDAPSQIEYDQELASVRAALDEEVFAAAWDEGQAMTLEQAIEYALEQYDEDL
jgi:predicted ATPase/DNA-binding SARP family transcriptional activator